MKILKIGFKDPSEFIDPFITISVKGSFCNRLTLLEKVCSERTGFFFQRNSNKFIKLVIASNFQLALDGGDVTVAQNTPTAKTKENRDIHFNCNVELQTTLEKLPEGIVQLSHINTICITVSITSITRK
jgi:hypothetical protein